jgi:hypothetical protein
MTSIRLSRMGGSSNIYSLLPVPLALSLSHERGLQAPAPFLSPLVQRDFPIYPRFLKRPRLLTRPHG